MERRAGALFLVDLRQAWPLLLVRAVLAVALGLVALIWPGITLVILAWAFGIYAIVDGVTQIVDGISHRDRPRWWLSLLLGLLGLVAGGIALVWPGITAVILAIVVGAWAVVSGAGEVLAAVRLLRDERRGGLLLLAGVLWVVAGVLILVWPVPGAIVLALLIGAFAVLYGIVLVVLALQLRSSATDSQTARARLRLDVRIGGPMADAVIPYRRARRAVGSGHDQNGTARTVADSLGDAGPE